MHRYGLCTDMDRRYDIVYVPSCTITVCVIHARSHSTNRVHQSSHGLSDKKKHLLFEIIKIMSSAEEYVERISGKLDGLNSVILYDHSSIRVKNSAKGQKTAKVHFEKYLAAEQIDDNGKVLCLGHKRFEDFTLDQWKHEIIGRFSCYLLLSAKKVKKFNTHCQTVSNFMSLLYARYPQKRSEWEVPMKTLYQNIYRDYQQSCSMNGEKLIDRTVRAYWSDYEYGSKKLFSLGYNLRIMNCCVNIILLFINNMLGRNSVESLNDRTLYLTNYMSIGRCSEAEVACWHYLDAELNNNLLVQEWDRSKTSWEGKHLLCPGQNWWSCIYHALGTTAALSGNISPQIFDGIPSSIILLHFYFNLVMIRWMCRSHE